MDPACLQHQVTDQERTTFERDGYLIVENAIPQSLVDRLVPISDRVDRQERDRMGKSPEARINHYDFIGKDDAYLELLDCPTTFPKVWGLLNWHIQLYHTHMTYTPPEPQGHSLETHGLGLGWHQDSGTLNQDLESTPRPRVSLKIAYFLTDTTQTGRGNFYVLPGSHLQDDFPGGDRKGMVDGGIPVCVPPGTAVFFDRRLWHSGSHNFWRVPRRVLFYGYSYRWLRPRDDMTVAHYLDCCDPIRQQLLGVTHSGGRGYTSPTSEDVPLRVWLEEQEAAAGTPV
ncbi:MAG: phytanoyl-CoA dioxygenase family protein [Candidatus Latescibacterota bacterium]|nr:phytanoyl-CoA dioxygenase family protein [Candidatus Latescibacterota bacterium]